MGKGAQGNWMWSVSDSCELIPDYRASNLNRLIHLNTPSPEKHAAFDVKLNLRKIRMSSIRDYYHKRYIDVSGTGKRSEDEGTFELRSKAMLRAMPNPPLPVLDFGCGRGAFAKRLVQSGYSVTGVDISDTALEIARKGISDAKF